MSPAVATRRQFLTQAARWGALAAAGSALPASMLELLGPAPAGAAVAGLEALLRDAPVARFWLSSDDPQAHCASCHVGPGAGPAPAGAGYRHRAHMVQCQLCPHQCVLAEGERGRCRVRVPVGGQLRSLVYGRPLSEHIDPIEKKPFYHFLPGSLAYSLATAGCPLRCQFCQNWEISQAQPEDYDTPYCGPADMARRVAAARGGTVPVVAFTYNEPTVFCEYLIDVADQVRADGRRTAVISCGYTAAEPLGQMLAALDAVKIDLKGFDPEFYRSVCNAELDPVLRSIRRVAGSGRHLELVNLVVPTLNDSERQLTDLAHWVANEVGPDVPVHFTRFHPDYRLRNLPPTPVETLERARAIAMDQGVRYAYVGNVPGHEGNHTYCPQCRQLCIERLGFTIASMRLVDGRCPACGTRIAGVWR